MANFSRKFESISGSYSGGYTSKSLSPLHYDTDNQITRGVIQIHIVSGSVTVQARLAQDAPWLDLKTYTSSDMEEVVLANQLRVVVSDEAHCWLGEVR
ncbi:hypothetical protein PP753_gp69 [Dinoroseobacter phage vB_DshP-R7L]|uniref:Uncharacterized protein n=1 Tax=Dinoroseobacter phage vB_DshP-R7L TaxID=2873349 RepID=A0AAE9BMM7_9CAUD|nr:hypothetical protein PP753_gp69 [Dinoroseobacter phage vB_DshP-R7L]UAT28889.1 hypothetical protein R7L_gp50 [Dinoroseobacter phage vB_DshP-R7L]